MIGNDTYALTLDSGYWAGAALALKVYRATPRPRRQRRIEPPRYRLARSVTDLRCAVNLAIACLRTGRTDEALRTLEQV